MKKRCSKCGGTFPCPEHTITINDVTDSIVYPEDVDEDTKQKIRDIKDTLSELL